MDVDHDDAQSYKSSLMEEGDDIVKAWVRMSEIMKRSVDSKFSLAQHHFEGESRFITQTLEKCIKEDPILKMDGTHYRYQMTLGRFHIERPAVYDPSLGQHHTLYPYEASWKDASYVCKVKLDIVFEVLSKDTYDLSTTADLADKQMHAKEGKSTRGGNKSGTIPKPPNILHSIIGNISPHVQPLTTTTSLQPQQGGGNYQTDSDEEVENESDDDGDNTTLSSTPSLFDRIAQMKDSSSKERLHPRLAIRKGQDSSSSTEQSPTSMDLDDEIERLVSDNDINPMPRPSTCYLVEDAASFTANIGEVYVQINGEMCNIKTSGGLMCHEDPDMEGGYHIVQGADKVTESQFTVRGNYIYVHFQNSSTSQSQSATAAEASNTDKSATADSPIILACDYRPTNESLFKFTAAFHVFLMVETPRLARTAMGRRVETTLYDSEAISPMSSPSVQITQESTTNNTKSKPMRGYWGYGENANISFPNIKQTNFNLVLIMFLLGLDSRNDMIRCIIPDEVFTLKEEGLLDDSSPRATLKDLPPSSSSHTRQSYLVYNEVYGLIHNQQMFPAEHNEDPNVYVHGVDTHKKWLYEDISKNHMPFVGFEDILFNPNVHSEQSSSQMWFRPDDFCTTYASASIDSWDRAAVIAHVVWILTHPVKTATAAGSGTTTSADGQKKSSSSSGHQQFTGTPSSADEKKFMVCLQRFSKSFVEEFLPHLGKTAHWRVVTTKTAMLGLVIRKLMLVYLGYIPPDNVDDLVMKMTETPGHLMARVFRTSFTKGVYKFMRQAVDRIEQCANETSTTVAADGGQRLSREDGGDNPTRMTHHSVSTTTTTTTIKPAKPLWKNIRVSWIAVALAAFPQQPFSNAMVRGMWSSGGPTVMDVRGSTKRLLPSNVATYHERMRCAHHVMNKKGATRLKDNSAQIPHDSQQDMFCPQRTHNDNQAGLDIHLARAAHIRIGYECGPLLGVVMRGCREPKSSPFFNHFSRLHSVSRSDSSSSIPPNSIPFLINGHNVGFTTNPVECVRALKLARYHGIFPFDVSISWFNGPIGCNPLNPLKHPMFHYIHLSGDWGSLLKPCIDLDHIWKLPSILLRYSTASGVFPNMSILGTAVEYAHLEPHPKDFGSALHLPMSSDVALEPGALFNVLVSEGLVVYRDAEEMRQEFICPSFRDFSKQAQHYMEKSHQHYWDSFSVGGENTPPKKSYSVIDLAKNTLAVPIHVRNSGNGVRFDWTLLAISEEFMLGVTASLAPFTNANDAARGSYSTGFTTQSTSAVSLNHDWKKNPYPMTLLEPKTSLAPNSLNETYSVMGTASAATESITAFYSRAHNGEDAIELSASPFGRYNVRHQVIVKCSALAAPKTPLPQSNVGLDSQMDVDLRPSNIPINSHAFSNPTSQSCVTLKSSDYSSIDSDGMPIVGSTVPPSGALVGCVLSVGRSDVFRDGTKTNQSRMSLHIDEFAEVHHGIGSSVDVSIKTSCIRAQETGDKLSTFPGQKGVIGAILQRYDSPYIKDIFGRGILPSFLRGSAGIPSRATTAEFREGAHAVKCLDQGRSMTVSPWGRDFEMWEDMSYYAPNFGSQVMVNAENGISLSTTIAVSILDYRMMHHLARETFNSRGLGAVDPRTQQPTEGAKKKGGAREGSLEAFNKTSQGATEVSEQLLFSASDPGFGHICQRCGLVGEVTTPSFLGEVLKAFEPQNIVRWFPHEAGVSDDERERRIKSTTRSASHYARCLHIAQSGPDVDCIGKRWVMSMLDRFKQRSGIEGRITLPSGGYCPGCKSVADVYAVKMPQIMFHILANNYMPGIAWRFVVDAKRTLGGLGRSGLVEHLEEVETGLLNESSFDSATTVGRNLIKRSRISRLATGRSWTVEMC